MGLLLLQAGCFERPKAPGPGQGFASVCSNGTLDAQFGISHDMPARWLSVGSGNSTGSAAIYQPDGKLVVAGTATLTGHQTVFLARLDGLGNLDSGFGSGGVALYAVGTPDSYPTAMALQSDGKIVVVGSSSLSGGNQSFFVARYTSAGALDAAFGTAGVFEVASGTFAELHGVIIDGSKVVAAGRTTIGGMDNFAILRLKSDGTTDNAFGTNGLSTFNFPGGNGSLGRSLGVQSTGNYIVGGSVIDGSSVWHMALIQVKTTDGSQILTFGTAGWALGNIGVGFSEGKQVFVLNDNTIRLVGDATLDGTNGVFAVMRFFDDGSVDPDFGGQGQGAAFHGVYDSDVSTQDAALQPDGRIVEVGTAANADDNLGHFVLTRINADGTVDDTFGNSGLVDLPFGLDATTSGVAADSSRIAAVGTVNSIFRVSQLCL